MPPENSPFAQRGRLEPSEDSAALPYYRRLRSRSGGRAPASRSRDIVQDVYDRMGVNYIRGRPSIDNLLEDNKALGHQDQEAEQSDSRGRSGLRPNLAVGARQRSRSHGRRQWPPSSNTESEKSTVEVKSTPKNPESHNWYKPSPNGGYKAERKSMPYGSSKSLLDVHGSDKRDEDSHTAAIEAPDDERDGLSVVSGKSMKSVKSTKSVKDRISAYGASLRNSMGSRKTYGHNTNTPRVANTNEGSVVSFPSGFDTASRFDQGSCISGGRERVPGHASVSQRSRRSGIADAFLNAVASSTPSVTGNISVVEIPKDGFHTANDQISVAASSVSGEDFAPSPRKKKMPTFRGGNASGVDRATQDCIESQFAMLNKKFDAEVRRIENRIDQECKARIEALEKKNEELVDLLARRGIKEGSKFF